jgi:hypothetical protein
MQYNASGGEDSKLEQPATSLPLIRRNDRLDRVHKGRGEFDRDLLAISRIERASRPRLPLDRALDTLANARACGEVFCNKYSVGLRNARAIRRSLKQHPDRLRPDSHATLSGNPERLPPNAVWLELTDAVPAGRDPI